MYKNFKKTIYLIFVMISVFTLFGPVTLAMETSTINNEINKTNDYVYKTISKTQDKAEKEVQKASNIIQKEEALDDSIDKLCEKLVIKTEKKVDKLIEKAADDGIEIIKDYIEVEIYDRIILVDPCYAH